MHHKYPGRSGCVLCGLIVASLSCGHSAAAWDYEGHRIINQLALASLPTNFPGFVRTPAALERIAFLANEPDRWRNTPDLPFKHCNEPDHYLDLDDLPTHGFDLTNLSPFRYEFAAHLAVARQRHPDRFPPIDPVRNSDKTREWVGFLPWTITEYQGQLKSTWSYLQTLQTGGAAEEVANAQANVIYVMGVMGHFVADAAQPLHTTKHYNGWVGDNPRGYSTNRTFHRWIDGGYIETVGLKTEHLLPRLRPARMLTSTEWPGLSTNVFPAVMKYVLDSFSLVESLYQLEKDHKLTGLEGTASPGYELISGQMMKAAQMLGDLWLTAWQQAPVDTYLERQLARRREAEKASRERTR